jgi:hypothetical protein
MEGIRKWEGRESEWKESEGEGEGETVLYRHM